VHREKKKTILLITHSMELARMTQRIVTIRDGRLISDVSSSPAAGKGLRGDMACSM